MSEIWSSWHGIFHIVCCYFFWEGGDSSHIFCLHLSRQAALNKNIDNEFDEEEVHFLLEKAPSIHTKRPRRVDETATTAIGRGKKSQIEMTTSIWKGRGKWGMESVTISITGSVQLVYNSVRTILFYGNAVISSRSHFLSMWHYSSSSNWVLSSKTTSYSVSTTQHNFFTYRTSSNTSRAQIEYRSLI